MPRGSCSYLQIETRLLSLPCSCVHGDKTKGTQHRARRALASVLAHYLCGRMTARGLERRFSICTRTSSGRMRVRQVEWMQEKVNGRRILDTLTIFVGNEVHGVIAARCACDNGRRVLWRFLFLMSTSNEYTLYGQWLNKF